MTDRYFIDSEFIDDGRTIDLISIGIVSDDGREYYAQVADLNPLKANPWVKEHVFPHLVECHACDSLTIHSFSGACAWRARARIREEIRAFIGDDDKPEFYGWCASYDWVALCQLFGTMMDLPENWPHYIHELQQVLDGGGIEDEDLPQQEEGLHHALEDARHIKRLWEFVVGK
jgi:hypothetical protein